MDGLHINDQAPNELVMRGRLALAFCFNCNADHRIDLGDGSFAVIPSNLCNKCGWNEVAALDMTEDEYIAFCGVRNLLGSSTRAQDVILSLRGPDYSNPAWDRRSE